MADGHLGYIMPIGGVAGYRNQESVIRVCFDIARGNATIRTDLRLIDARYWANVMITGDGRAYTAV